QVAFPNWPNGTADCFVCHGDAPNGDVENRPEAGACLGCHSDTDVRGGTNHLGGPAPDDTQCALCHTPELLLAAHEDPRAAVDPGLTVSIVAVRGGSGPNGALQPGDELTVEYTAVYDDGTPLDFVATPAALSEVVLAGPSTHFQQALVSAFGAVPAASVYDPVAGTFSFPLGAVPSVYPAQPNDTADLGVEHGDWVGLPLAPGTYRLGMSIARSVTDGVTTWRVPASAWTDVLLGDATTLEPRAVIDEDACLSCHQRVQFHGDNREGVGLCLTCHVDGAEDRYSTTDPTTTPGVTIALQALLHRIHAGSELTLPYTVNGFGSPYTAHTYEWLTFPRRDGGVADCAACHGGSDSWLAPSARVCTSCHDSVEAAAHAAINTDPVFGETCDLCHATGASYAVDAVHTWGTPR
ncbi:MAG: hypothetical protein ABMA64_41845, partial [Myxococcota bacterium]